MAFDIEAYPGGSGFDIEIEDVEAPTLASGTTLALLQAGSSSIKYTVAIEGYPYLLTDATPQQAIDAWYDETSTARYTQAIDGLFVSMENRQQLDWRNPFPRGGSLLLQVVPTTTHRFRIDTQKKSSPTAAQTELDATLDRDDTTVTVVSTTGFATSGEIHIGTECIAYTGITATSFTGCTRGMYAPLCRGGTGGDGYSQTHRVGTGISDVLLQPKVTTLPEKWIGRLVSVYLHKYDASIPAINSKDDALRVFAGKITEVRDDPQTGAITVEVKHALDCVAEANIGGRDQWKGKITNSLYIKDGWRFKMKDQELSGGGVLTEKEADDLVVVASGATPPLQINEGFYTPDEIYEFLNTYWASEFDNANLYNKYSAGYWHPDDGSVRTYIYWSKGGTPSGTGFEFGMPQPVAAFLGYNDDGGLGPIGGAVMSNIKSGIQTGAGPFSEVGDEVMRRYMIATGATGIAEVIDAHGTFKDQYAFLPSSITPPANFGDGWGVFMIDNRLVAYGWKSNLSNNVHDLTLFPEQFGLEGGYGIDWHKLPLTQSTPKETEIRQIFVLEMTFGDAMKRLMLSTGTGGYNHATWDALAHGLGLGMPYDVCDAQFIASIDSLPNANLPIQLLIDRTVTLSRLIAGELILRRAFLRWNNELGILEFCTWRSLVEGNSEGTLDEDNKAAPAGTIDHHRSVTVENGAWAVPNVTIQYNRSLKASADGNEGYRDSVQIIDRASLDDMGGDGPSIIINAKGTLGDFHQTGATIGSLSNGFISSMPYFSRPARLVSRSIDSRFFCRTIGDIMLVSDDYACDPETGERGVTRHGIIIGHRWTLGGPRAGSDKPDDMGGDVDLFFLDQNRVAEYVPAAQVDDTATNGGYNAGTNTLTVYSHKYSETSEATDVSRFAVNDRVHLFEIDPSDPTAGLAWSDNKILSITGNDIELDDSIAGIWDSGKRYRLAFADYVTITTTQRLKTFQADDSDLLVQNLRAPYEYGVGGGSSTFTAWTASDDVELPPNASYGDGVGRDTGHEIALVRLLNNLNNYKTCVSSPCLANTVLNPNGAVTFGSSTWMLVQCRPVYLTAEVLLSTAQRELSVSPHFRSANGNSANLRVTLSRTPPTGATFFDVDRGSIYSEVTFNTTSTTWATASTPETLLMTNVKGMLTNCAWLYVEVDADCETYGLALVQEGHVF